MISKSTDFTHVSGPLGDLLKEIFRRSELRPRQEAELSRFPSDEEFLQLAEQTGRETSDGSTRSKN